MTERESGGDSQLQPSGMTLYFMTANGVRGRFQIKYGITLYLINCHPELDSGSSTLVVAVCNRVSFPKVFVGNLPHPSRK